MAPPEANLLLVPPDTRPPTLDFPVRLAEAAGFQVAVPPRDALPLFNQPGDRDLLVEWLREQAAGASILILSLETLCLGGVIPARRVTDEPVATVKRLELIPELKKLNPKLRILAGGVIVRVARDDDPFEEKPYYGEYGHDLRSYSEALDRYHRLRTRDDERRLQRAVAKVPSDILDDWLDTRRRNHEIHLRALELIDANSINHLCLTLDDTSEYGLAARDRRALEARTDDLALWDRVDIYPGADEVPVTLLARAVQDRATQVRVRYSGVAGSTAELLYEDRRAGELVKAHLRAAGCALAEPRDEADLVLAVNTPGSAQSHEQPDYLTVDTPARHLPEFVDFMVAAMQANVPLTLADIAYPNGAEVRLLQLMKPRVPLAKLAGYSGWNTAANTLGSAIAMGVVSKAMRDPAAWTEVLFNRLVDDYLYQARVRSEVDESLQYPSPFDLGSKKQAAEVLIEQRLRPLALELWSEQFAATGLELAWREPHLAWSRLFTGVFPFRVSSR